MSTDSLDTAKVASELGTDARTLRKFLRSSASPLAPVGQGARYVIGQDDLPELKTKFTAWQSGKSPSRSDRTSASGEPKRRASRAVAKVDPLSEDDMLARLNSSIGDRQRKHGVICSHSWPHPKVKGLTVKCTSPTVAGTRFCKFHPQVTWCGDEEPIALICGPSPELHNQPTGHPYCRYHNGDISEKEFNKILLDNPDGNVIE
jgi:hypothetical protein